MRLRPKRLSVTECKRVLMPVGTGDVETTPRKERQMKETEKIEIMHFDQEGYLEDGKALYETGKKMTALADKVLASI